MPDTIIHRDSSEPQHAFIAVFDVLGFKDRLAQTPLKQLIDTYRLLIDAKVQAGRIPVASANGLSVEISGTTIFSDTIVVWCDDSWPAVQSFLASCSLLVATALRRDWPLRGGIAYGEVVLDRVNRMFVGQPIVDAHLTEISQDWVGAAFHPTVFSHPLLGAQIAVHDEVIACAVPIKSGAGPLTHALHWCPHAISARAAILKLRAGSSDPSVRLKYDNTLKYLDDHCSDFHANN